MLAVLTALCPTASAGGYCDGCPFDNFYNGTLHGGIYFDCKGWYDKVGVTETETFENVPDGRQIVRFYPGIWTGSPTSGADIDFSITINENPKNSFTYNNGGRSSCSDDPACNIIPTPPGCTVRETGCGCDDVRYDNAAPDIVTGNNTISFWTNEQIYQFALLTVYENDSMPPIQYWIKEGHEYPDEGIPYYVYFNETANTGKIYLGSLKSAEYWNYGYPHLFGIPELNGYDIGGPDVKYSNTYDDIFYGWLNIPADYITAPSNAFKYEGFDNARLMVAVLVLNYYDPSDLAVTDISPQSLYANYINEINATVTNYGKKAKFFNVTLYANDTKVDVKKVTNLSQGNSTEVTFLWNPEHEGMYVLNVTADVENVVLETNDANNSKIMEVNVELPSGPVWRDQSSNVSTIHAGEAIELRAQGKAGTGLYNAILATDETGTWKNITDGRYGSPMNMASYYNHSLIHTSDADWNNQTKENLSIVDGDMRLGQYGAGSENLALKKNNYSSSESAYDEPKENANDGIHSTGWCSADDDMPCWWYVDLGGVKDVNKIKFYGYCYSSPLTYKILISNDNETWTEKIVKYSTATADVPDVYTECGWSCRYINVTITKNDYGGGQTYGGFAELEAYPPLGYKSTGTLMSKTIETDNPIVAVTPTWNSTDPAGTNLSVNVSVDGGATWNTAVNGTKLTWDYDGNNTKLKYKVLFETTDINETPVLHDIMLNYTTKDAPKDTWVWSNFTWQNASVTAGTTVGWKIRYNDTAGQTTCTDVMSFDILSPDTTPPYTEGHDPAPGVAGVPRNTNIVVHVKDDGDGVDNSTITMKVGGVDVTSNLTISGDKNDYMLIYNPPTDFDFWQVVNVTVNASDLALPPNSMTYEYSFTIIGDKPDLIVKTIDAYHYTTAAQPYSNLSNEVDVVIENIGSGAANVSNVSLYIDGNFTDKKNVPAIGAGNSTTVQFKWTPIGEDCEDGGSPVDHTLKAIADCDNAIDELNETNNASTKTETAYWAGWSADELFEVVQHGTIRGGLNFTTGDGVYSNLYNPGDTATVHYDVTLPGGATVELARLNVYYTWSKYGYPMMEVNITNTTGKTYTVPLNKSYNDRPCDSPPVSYNYPYGNYVYDLTPYIKGSGTYTVVVKNNGTICNFNIAAPGLVILYKDNTKPLFDYWLLEGADILEGGRRGGAGYLALEECINNATFEGTVGITNATTATLGVVSAWGESAADKNYLYFNGNVTGTGVYHGYSSTYDKTQNGMSMHIGSTNSQMGVNISDVKDYLAASDNVVGQGDNGDSMMVANAFLLVELKEERPEAPFFAYGFVLYEGGSECNNPVVNITNLNASEEWQAETISGYNYYQLILDTTNVSAGDVLVFNATDGTYCNTTSRTVTVGDINIGGIFSFNLTLPTLPAVPPSIVSYAPETPVSDTEGATRKFNITVNQTVNVSWLINGTEAQPANISVTEASYTNTSAVAGYWNVSAIAANANGTDIQTWWWTVIVTDITPPIITFVLPTPENNTEVSVDYVFVNVTLNENGNKAILNWNGSNETMLGVGMNFYKNMTAISNGIYTYKVYANDTSDNWNVSETRIVTVNVTLPDTTPPASITNLTNVTGHTWINWTWDNPTDAYFNHTMVYLAGTWQTNTSDAFYNATGLNASTSYEIGTHTVDTIGNVNETWVNQTAKTLSYGYGAPNITFWYPFETEIDNTEGESRTFKVAANQTVNVMWYINESLKHTNESVPADTNATYTNTSASAGTWNVSAIASNTNGTAMQTWMWNVAPIEPENPFFVYGRVFYEDETACNGPIVNVTNLNTSKEWQAETNASFNYYPLVLDSKNVSAGNMLEFYATDGTLANITTHTVTQGDLNSGGVFGFNLTLPIAPDTTPPASITGLANSTYAQTYINWTWTNPGDGDFNHTMVYINGSWEENVSTPLNYYNATGLSPSTNNTISTHTVDTSGNINQTWVNHTARTAAAAVQEGFWLQTTDADFNEGTKTNITVSGNTFQLSAVPSTVTIFHETFPYADGAWGGSNDLAQDEPGWVTIQGDGDPDDIQVSDEDKGGSSPSGGNHLTFEDCDHGFHTPEDYDIAYVSIDLSGYSGVEISYYWQSDDVDSDEGLRVAYSTDSTDGKNGTWTPMDEHINEADDVWVNDTYISLPDADGVANFKLRFSAKMGSPNEHMYVDDVMVTGEGAGGYETSGSLISQTHDTGASEPAYTDIIVGNSTPEGTTITVEVRAASTEAGLNSTAWHTDIANVPHEQWVQWNVSLTGDGTNTPTVDDVNVTWTSEPDTTAPAAVEDLAASEPTSSSIKLTWTAPGDDGNTGTAMSYDIRYSTTTINDSNWNSANCTEQEPNPKPANSSENFTVTGLNANTTYYFALKTSDEVPNESPLSNVPNGTTESEPENQPPVSDPNGPYEGTEGVPITFNGSGSYDPDGTIELYEWDFGDGNTGTGVSPNNTYTQNGTYTVNLTVTDNKGATDMNTTTATVTSAPVVTTYDFTSGAGSDKWAYRKQHNKKPPATNDVPSIGFESAQYNNIKMNDSTYQEEDIFTNGYYAIHRFTFDIAEPVENITKLGVLWDGKGYMERGTNGATLYIWNVNTGKYEQLDKSTNEYITLTGTITTNIENYINAGSNLTIVAEQNTKAKQGKPSKIGTDYVKVDITHT